jgi:hypothetical protein
MHVCTSQLSIKNFKRSSIWCSPTNQSRSPEFLRRPHFVGDFLCRRSCFNLQPSSESSCKAPSFCVWKTWGCFSDNFCDCFVLRVCSGFRVLLRGGGSENLWKTELDWVLGIPFRVLKKSLQVEALRPSQCQRHFFIQSFWDQVGKENLYIGRPFHWGFDKKKQLFKVLSESWKGFWGFWTCLSFHLFKILY